ncbi:MAG: cell division protein FtsQ/DivIB [Acidimicrobiales bacterium]
MTATAASKKSKKNKKRKNPSAARSKRTKKAAATRKRPPATRAGDRFQARRQAVERSEGLKRLRVVLGLTLVSTLAIGVIGFLNSSAFDVDRITVSGNDRSDPHLIVESSDIAIGQALLEVDLDRAVGQVELVPWVGTATVTRSWNGSVNISVTERGPSAVLSAGDRFALVDDHGRQLEIVDRRPDGYMPVRGIEGSGVAGEPAPTEALPVIALLQALPPEVEQQIGSVLLEDGELFLELSGGGRANFGDGSDLGPKLQSLETMLARVDLTCLNTIDVRVPAAPVLTRTGRSAAQSGSSGGLPTEGEPNEEPDSTGSDC